MAGFKSVTAVRRKLQKENWANIPTDQTIRAIFQRFKETGSVQDREREGRPSNEENRKETLSALIEQNPGTSIREMYCSTGFSYGSIQSTLKNVSLQNTDASRFVRRRLCKKSADG